MRDIEANSTSGASKSVESTPQGISLFNENEGVYHERQVNPVTFPRSRLAPSPLHLNDSSMSRQQGSSRALPKVDSMKTPVVYPLLRRDKDEKGIGIPKTTSASPLLAASDGHHLQVADGYQTGEGNCCKDHFFDVQSILNDSTAKLLLFDSLSFKRWSLASEAQTPCPSDHRPAHGNEELFTGLGKHSSQKMMPLQDWDIKEISAPSSRGKARCESPASKQACKSIQAPRVSQKRSQATANFEDIDEDLSSGKAYGDAGIREIQDAKPLACPYYRKDPIRYFDCIHRKLNRIRDLKQHLQRRHTFSHSCTTCLQGFASTQLFEQHLRYASCTPALSGFNDDGVSPKAQELLRDRVDRKLSRTEQWHKIWSTLFDNMDAPSRPFLDSVAEEVLNIIQSFCERDGRRIISEFAQSRGLLIYDVEALQSLLMHLLIEIKVNIEQTPLGSVSTEANTGVETRADNTTSKAEQVPLFDGLTSLRTEMEGSWTTPVFQTQTQTSSTRCSAPSSIASDLDAALNFSDIQSTLLADVPYLSSDPADRLPAILSPQHILDDLDQSKQDLFIDLPSSSDPSGNAAELLDYFMDM